MVQTLPRSSTVTLRMLAALGTMGMRVHRFSVIVENELPLLEATMTYGQGDDQLGVTFWFVLPDMFEQANPYTTPSTAMPDPAVCREGCDGHYGLSWVELDGVFEGQNVSRVLAEVNQIDRIDVMHTAAVRAFNRFWAYVHEQQGRDRPLWWTAFKTVLLYHYILDTAQVLAGHSDTKITHEHGSWLLEGHDASGETVTLSVHGYGKAGTRQLGTWRPHNVRLIMTPSSGADPLDTNVRIIDSDSHLWLRTGLERALVAAAQRHSP
jgi:hypothetical protein